jgi:hypothetical protein
MRLPRVLSPQMHRRIDLVAFPSVIASVVWMSRRDSRAATLHGILAASLALLVPGIPLRGRRVVLALGAMPIVLSALSDTREQ